MNIFYVDAPLAAGMPVVFPEAEHRHISSVLRKPAGSEIYITNGQGFRAVATITEVLKKTTVAEVKSVEFFPEGPPRVLFLGLLKQRDRMDWAIEKAVELGVTKLFMVDFDHSEKDKVREDRTESLIIAALKQSMRSWKPLFEILSSAEEAIQKSAGLHRVVAHEKVALEHVFSPDRTLNYAFFVGPEGGFSTREIAVFESEKVDFISLGANRLRAETAGITLLAKLV